MIRVRPIEVADIHKILELEQILYGRPFSIQWLDWKYYKNPHGKAIVLVAETAEDQLVGLRSFWPRQFVLNDRILLAYQAVDVGVHPDYRRQGIFTLLTHKAIELALEQGAVGFFNFPHQTSMPGYLKLGWLKIRRLHWWMHVTPESRARQPRDIQFDELNLSPSAGKGGAIARFLRDPDYLKWRYFQRPDAKYQFCELGVLHGETIYAVTRDVTRKTIPVRVLVDVIGDSIRESDVSELFRRIVVCSANGIKPLVILEGTLGYQKTLLLRNWFIRVPKWGVNYVVSDRGSSSSFIPFDDLWVAPGDMDTF